MTGNGNVIKLPIPEPKRLPRPVAEKLNQAIQNINYIITCLRSSERNLSELIYAYSDYIPKNYELSIVVNGHQMNDIIDRVQAINGYLSAAEEALKSHG